MTVALFSLNHGKSLVSVPLTFKFTKSYCFITALLFLLPLSYAPLKRLLRRTFFPSVTNNSHQTSSSSSHSVLIQAHKLAYSFSVTNPRATWSYHILFSLAIICFLSSLPYFAPSNLLELTKSDADTPVDEIFARLINLRSSRLSSSTPNWSPGSPVKTHEDFSLNPTRDPDSSHLTPLEQVLRSRLTDSYHLKLYLKHGPNAIADCHYCFINSRFDFLDLYSIVKILKFHFVHFILLGLATSTFLSFDYAARWRSWVVLLSTLFLLFDLFIFLIDSTWALSNGVTTDFVKLTFWQLRNARYLFAACMDIFFGWAIWGSIHGHWPWQVNLTVTDFALNVVSGTKRIEGLRTKLQALDTIHSVIRSQGALRTKMADFALNKSECEPTNDQTTIPNNVPT